MKNLIASLRYINRVRAAVPAIGAAAFLVSTALFAPSVVQAAERLIKITTLEPGTERDGTCDPPVQRGEPLVPLPPELDGLAGYTQECEEGAGSGAPGSGREDLWELETNRFLPGTSIVNKGEVVTLEFHGIRGKTHNTQIFRPGYEIVIRPDGLQGVSGIGADNCIFTDTGAAVPANPNNMQGCFFPIPRGDITRVTLVADQHGAWLIHCHTHGTAMQADLIVLKSASP